MADVQGTLEVTLEPALMHNLTLAMRVSRSFRFRLWLALLTFRLAARLMGTGFDLQVDD